MLNQHVNPYPDSRHAKAEFSFGIIDVDAAASAEAAASSEAGISKIAQTHDGITEMAQNLATCELNQLVLDGAKTYLSKDTEESGQLGWWGDEMSGRDGYLTSGITYTWEEDQSSVGFTVYFDEATDNFAADFTIRAYDGQGALIAEDSVTGNQSPVYVSNTPVDRYRKVTVDFTRTSLPYRRMRVSEMQFGIIETYGENDLKEARLIYEISPDSAALPAAELTIRIDNQNKRYNIINPKGIYKYLQQGQKIAVRLGVGESLKGVEMQAMGNFYYTSSKTEDGGLVAAIVAHNLFYALESGMYRKGIAATGTLGDAITDIIEDSGLDIAVQVDEDAASREIGLNFPVVSRREALRMALEAGRAIGYLDRVDTLVVRDNEIGDVSDTLNKENLYDAPDAGVADYYNVAEVSVYSFSQGSESELYNSVEEVNGIKAIWVTYGSAASSVSAAVTGGVILTAEYYLYACRLTIQAAGSVTIVVTGRSLEMNESVQRASSVIGTEPEFVVKVANPLVRSPFAAEFAEWALRNARNRVTYKMKERGNPAREIGDTVRLSDPFNENQTAVITREEYVLNASDVFYANTQAVGGMF